MTKKEKAATKRYKLRKCPFCGFSVRAIVWGLAKKWVICCIACNKQSVPKSNREEAAKAWNGVK